MQRNDHFGTTQRTTARLSRQIGLSKATSKLHTSQPALPVILSTHQLAFSAAQGDVCFNIRLMSHPVPPEVGAIH